MNLSDMDIKTIISLLFIGNFIELVILIFYRNIPDYRRPYWHFIAGKMLQSLAWLLLSLRVVIPDIVSVYIGNTLLISGFALEVFSLTTVGRSEKKWGVVYFSISAIGIAAFWIFASTPNLWVGFATTVTIALFLPASVSMFFAPASSLMRKITGLFYGIACVAIAFRAWNGFFVGSEFVLMSRNLIQTLSFATMFLLLIVGGNGFLLLFKEQADELIGESEKKYRELVENANSIIYKCDTSGRLIYFNEFAQSFFGYTAEEVLGKNVIGIILPDTDQNDSSMFDTIMAVNTLTDKYKYNEKECMRKNGDKAWVAWTNKVIYGDDGTAREVLCVGIDITERKRMENILKDSEEKYRNVFATETDALFLIDKETGAILEVNDAAYRLYGYIQEEMLKLRNTDMSAEPDNTERATREFRNRIELRFHKKKDGTVFPVDISASIFYLKNRQVILASIRDISERIRAEEDRERLILELRDALSKIKTLSGMLPICSSCKKIRDDKGYWNQIESFIKRHSEAEFSHSICPECAKVMYPDFYKKMYPEYDK